MSDWKNRALQAESSLALLRLAIDTAASGREQAPPSEIASLRQAVEKMRRALEPFAAIALERDSSPDAPDMICGPDLAITPSHVRAGRAALSSLPAGEKIGA